MDSADNEIRRKVSGAPLINEIEVRINSFFNQKEDVERLNNELIHTYRLKETIYEHKVSILNFFIRSGQIRTAYRLMVHDVKNEKLVHWGHLLTIIFATKTPPNEELKEALKNGILTQNGEERAAQSRYAQLLEEELGWARENIRKRYQEDFQKNKELLFQKLEFYRNEQIYKDEKRILDQIEFLYPNDERLPHLKEDYDQRWARELITSKSHVKLDKPIVFTETKEETEFSDQLFSHCRQLCKEKPNDAYSFSLMFYFMGKFLEALKLIAYSPKKMSTDWFRVEILFELKRYVECLSELEKLENEYNQYPDTAFATSYFKAQCYWELKQPGLAIQVMQSLLQIKPEYRSADSFMAKWTQGEPKS